jgi:hypothetical protein
MEKIGEENRDNNGKFKSEDHGKRKKEKGKRNQRIKKPLDNG